MTQSFLYFVVPIPLVLVAVLAARIWSHKGSHPPTYELSESWAQTSPPILWAATDEVIDGGHGQHGRGEPAFSVGGGASGTW